MNKIVRFGKDANVDIIEGINTVADIVKTTVGPKGRNVLIRENLSRPIITNDGVTIAKAIQLKDNAQDAGAQLIIGAASKTNEVAGDGTTTTTILAQEMIKQYLTIQDNVENAVQIQKEMLKAGDNISDAILKQAIPVEGNEAVKRVATVSSGDADVGELIARAFESAGEYGSVIVEDSKTGEDQLVEIQGMKLSSGSVSSYLLNDRINGKTDMVDVDILVLKDKIDNSSYLLPVLEYFHKSGRKALILCDDIEFDPLQMLIMNKIQGAALNISIVRLPGFGELRENLIEDICIATGAQLIGREVGTTLKDFSSEMLGEAEQVIVTMDDAIIKFKDVTSTSINLLEARQHRVAELSAQMEVADNKEPFKRRISNLISGISIIQVGGNSDIEIKDKKLRIEDAINSVQSALEEGIVSGGGFSFLKILIDAAKENRHATIGEKIVYDSLQAVTYQIAENAGFDGPQTVSNCFNKELGFNALTGKYEDLISTGVINAAKVDRYSVLNAVSVASTVITMGGVIVDENEKDQNILQLQAPVGPLM